jgi:4-hydroxy-tetrahydrodipicolinate reductase
MGRGLAEVCRGHPGVVLTAAIEHSGSPSLGKDTGVVAGGAPVGVLITDRLDAVLEDFDVLVEFTEPTATLDHLRVCRRAGRRMVIGTTGIPAAGLEAIAEASRDCAIVLAPNMSVGVNLCFKLLELAARVLRDDYDVEVIEAHHRHKVDAPSGTALRMGEVVAQALGRDLSEVGVYERHGIIGPRRAKQIGFQSLRAGDLVGEHTVMFAGLGERIEITHRASSRDVFARGALRAAAWVMPKERGLYDMLDVLGLKEGAYA